MTTATCTCSHATRSDALSEQEDLRHNIARLVKQVTNNGATLVQKYHDFINGEYPDAKPYLIYSAMRDLSIMGGGLPEDIPGSPIHVIREKDADDDSAPKPEKPKITTKEILNWDMGRSARAQTNNCQDLIDALQEMMNPRYVFPSSDPHERKYQRATEIKPHHEFRAMQEMLRRSRGSQNPYAYAKTSAAEERMLHSWLSDKMREKDGAGIDYITYLVQVIRNPKFNAWGEIITQPYTQSQRLWSIKHLLWRAADIPWEHITHEDIAEYYRGLSDKQRQETERLLSDRKPPEQLTPAQEAHVRALLDETHRQAEQADRRAAQKAAKKAKKAAKKADASKRAIHDYNNADNRSNADTGKSAGNADGNNASKDANGSNGDNAESAASAKNGENDNNPADTNAPTSATPPISDRGETAVANALARHPEVDLDTALANHHATAGIPKENLTHEQIYDAITAEANFQKRQAIIQNRLRSKNPDAATEDNDPPKSRSP